MGPMTDLSPTARAVMDAYNRETWSGGDKEWEDAPAIAAALRAAARHAVFDNPVGLTPYAGFCQLQNQLNEIATELESLN